MASPAAAGPGSGFAVTVADIASTSAAFARQHDAASAAVATASRALASSAGMGGDDPVLAEWRNRYDAVASITWLGTGAMSSSLHGIADLLVDTADAYLAAEHASTPRRTGAPERLQRPAAAAPLPAGPPQATGPTGDEVPPDRAEYWPGGDPERLRAAAAAWSTLAAHLDRTAYAGDSAFRALVRHNHGATFSAMDGYWSRRFVPDAFDPLYNAVPRTANILGQVCRALAELIERTRHDVGNAVADALHDTAGAEAVARVPLPVVGTAGRIVALLAPAVVASGYVQLARDYYLSDLHELTAQLGPDLEDRLRRAVTTELPPDADPRRDPQVGLRAADVREVLTTGLAGSGWDDVDGPHPDPDRIHVPEARRVHILDGDATGGGHRSGAGIPGKDEFPLSWTDERIITNVLGVARRPDGAPERRPDGTWQVEGTRDGVRLVIALDTNGSIITGYPQPGPGVTRNPP